MQFGRVYNKLCNQTVNCKIRRNLSKCHKVRQKAFTVHLSEPVFTLLLDCHPSPIKQVTKTLIGHSKIGGRGMA